MESRVMKRVIAVCLLTLSLFGCNLVPEKVYTTANVVTLFEQANLNHDKVVKILFDNVDKFSVEELEVLENSYYEIESNRSSLALSLKEGVVETLVSSGQAIKQYNHIRQYYGDAILIVESKLDDFTLREKIAVARQINTTKRLDEEIGRLLSSPDGADQREGFSAMVNLLTLFAKVLLAIGI